MVIIKIVLFFFTLKDSYFAIPQTTITAVYSTTILSEISLRRICHETAVSKSVRSH